MRVLKGKARQPQGLKLCADTQIATLGTCSASQFRIATFGLSNNIQFNPEHVQKCYTKHVGEGKATFVVEMNRGVQQWSFYVQLSGADPEQLQRLINMSPKADIADS